MLPVFGRLSPSSPTTRGAGRSEHERRTCKATVDMFGLTMDDFVPQVEDIISVGEFYEQAAGGEIIFT